MTNVSASGAGKSVRAATLEKAMAEWTGRDMNALNTIAFKVGVLAQFHLVNEDHAERSLEFNAKSRGYFDAFGENETKIALMRRYWEGRRCPVAKNPANDNAGLITATPYEWRETSTIQVRSFVYGEHLIRGYVTVDVAPGGVGKSTQIITDALALTTGRMLLGIEPADKLRCWLWNGEDPRDEIERRIAAACAFHKISKADIGGRLFVDSGRDKEIVIVTEDRNRIVYAVPVVEAVKATIRANNIDVFIVDPFVTTHGVPENDNTKIAAVAKQWAQIADDTKCAVQIVHHVRKGDGRGEITVEDMRGAGSLANAARFVRLLNPMTTDEESSAGLKRGDRFCYFRVTNGKSNLTPRSEHSEWRQIVSQPMGNGTPLGPPQDRVGVVTRWQWPSAASLVEGLPNGALDTIKARLRGGDYREHELASNWAGLVVADVLKIELVDKGAKKQVKRMLQAWIDAGHLRIETKRDAVKRETKKFVVPVDKPAPV